MALYQIPVVLPYQTEHDEQAPLFSLHVEAVASNQRSALAAAKALTRLVSLINHGKEPAAYFIERAMIGEVEHQVLGPYAYVIGKGNRVALLSFPTRLDHELGKDLEETLRGLQEEWVHGVLVDCAALGYINSAGLAALSGHGQRLNIHCCRTQPQIRKIMAMIGLDKICGIHGDMMRAMEVLLARA